MKCREAKELMYLFRAGEIPETARRQIRQHVESCEGCAEEFREIERAWGVVQDLRSAGPRLLDQRSLTEQIMREIGSSRGDVRALGREIAVPFRRLQIGCTLAAAAIVAVFLIENVYDTYRVATLESRLNQLPSVMAVGSGEPYLAAAGLSTIAEITKFLSAPPGMDSLNLRQRQELRDLGRSASDALREGSPALSREVDRLRQKYPALWDISPLDGFTDHDRLVLDRERNALMKDLRALLQEG
jgi:hypothetical protein